MTIYEDEPLGGAWCHCRTCHYCGDVLELASTVWDMAVDTSLTKLVDNHVDISQSKLTSAALREHDQIVRTRGLVLEFWNKSRHSLADGTAIIGPWLRKLSVDKRTLTSSHWMRTGGQLLGCASVEDFQTMLATVFPGTKLHTGVFKDWDSIFLLPFHDLPGRISAFLCLDMRTEPLQAVFRSVRKVAKSNQNEAGIAISSAAEQNDDKPLLAITDATVALRLQLMHCRSNDTLLPVVGTHEGRSYQSQSSLRSFGRIECVWSPGSQLSAIAQARRASGQIASPAIGPGIDYIANQIPAITISRLQQMAIPWEDALERHLISKTPGAAEESLIRLAMTHTEQRQFLAGCSFPLARVLEERLRRIPRQKVRVNGSNIIETEDGWMLDDSGEVISEAVLVLEEVCWLPTLQETYYRGVVRFRGQAFDFTISDKQLKLPLQWMRDELLSRGMGLATFNVAWQRYALQIAEQLHRPVATVGLDGSGWQPRRRGFSFPQFFLRNDGHVLPEPATVLDPQSGGIHFEPPSSPTLDVLRLLSEPTPAVKTYWGVLAFTIYNLLAPAKGWSKLNLCLHGVGAVAAGHGAAKAAGCRARNWPSTVKAFQQFTALRAADGWPELRIWGPAGGHRFKTSCLEATLGTSDNIILDADWYSTQVLASYGWVTLEDEEPVGNLDELRQAAKQIVPTYLQYLCQNGMNIRNSQEMLHSVARNLAVWFEEVGGRPQIAQEAVEHLQTTSDSAGRLERFYAILARLWDHGLLPAVRTPSEFSKLPSLLTQNETTFISRRHVGTMLRSCHAPPLDFDHLADDFQSTGTDVKEGTVAHMSGWHCGTEWLTKILQRQLSRRRLRLVP
jgi:hypothetical protein